MSFSRGEEKKEIESRVARENSTPASGRRRATRVDGLRTHFRVYPLASSTGPQRTDTALIGREPGFHPASRNAKAARDADGGLAMTMFPGTKYEVAGPFSRISTPTHTSL